MTTLWIGPDDNLSVGDIGFLIEKNNTTTGVSRYDLRDLPAHTNQSHEPLLHGWCGTYNGLATYGRGIAKVERVAKNGRAFVRELAGDERDSALDELGYPDLA